MPARGEKNYFRVNHFISVNDSENYNDEFEVLTDMLKYYDWYYNFRCMSFEEPEHVKIILDDIKNYILVMRDDSGENAHTTRFAKVVREVSNGPVTLSVLDYNTYNECEAEIFIRYYTFKTLTKEKDFCKIVRDNLRVYRANKENYDILIEKLEAEQS